MKPFIERYRNIGIIAHIDAGKTTTTERILYYTGKKYKIVEIHDTKDGKSSTDTDYLKQEKERGITIQSAAVTVNWKDHQINLIDTPGHVDFTIEVNRSLRVLDGAVVVFDAVAGVEPQTETNWRLADQYDVPRICYVNKMDRTGANFFKTCEMISTKLGSIPLICHIPIGEDENFTGMVDLVTMQKYTWEDDDKDRQWIIEDISSDDFQEYRSKLIETVLEQDEDAYLIYLENNVEPYLSTIKSCIRSGTLNGSFVPVFCGSSFKNKGVNQLLDAIVDYLPSPMDVKAIATVDEDGNQIGERRYSRNEPFSALAFKVINSKSNTLTFARIYSGVVTKGSNVLNSTRGKVEKVGRIVEIHGADITDIKQAEAGDIIAFVSMKDTETGDTLCDISKPVILERMRFPEPVISVSVEAINKIDSERMVEALAKMVKADPSLQLNVDPETQQLVLRGMGELHLEITLDRMKTEMNVSANMGKPLVAYKETFTKSFDTSYFLHQQTGGNGQYAKISIVCEPLPRGSGFEFVDKIKGGVIPSEYVKSVEYGFREQAKEGILAGYPTVDFRITLVDGDTHSVDSSGFAFERAARACFRENMMAGKPAILEPIMKAEIVAPAEYLGVCLGEISKRRGAIIEQDDRNNIKVIGATIPLSELFGFIGMLRTITSGRGNFSMDFSHYDEVPKHHFKEVSA